MAKLLSGTLQSLNLGIPSYSESKKVLTVVGLSTFTGDVNISGVATVQSDLYVLGDLNVTGDIVYDEVNGRNLNLSGVSTFGGNVNFNSTITVGGTTGTNGQYLQSTGTGVTWASAASIRSDNSYTATAGQTTISQTYTAGLIDVYVNGVRLTDSEYTASNGTSIVLNEALFGGETIDVISFTSAGSVSAGAESDTLDTVTGRGGDTTNNINVGILTAKSGIYVDTIRRYTDNSTNTKITLDQKKVRIFAGNGTTPKVNINNGVGINTTLNVTGVSTFQNNVHLPDNTNLKIGSGDDFSIHHDGSNTTIQNSTGFLKQTATNGSLYLQSNLAVELTAHNDAEKLAKFIKDGAVELYHDNSKKFETTTDGATVTGDLRVGSSDSNGVILTSPNGTEYRLTVDNSGNLSTTAV